MFHKCVGVIHQSMMYMPMEYNAVLLEIVVEPNTTPQNQFVRWGLPPLINTLSDHLLSDVGFLTHPLMTNTIELGSWTSMVGDPIAETW